MRLPPRFVAGHLLWTRAGQAWAVWQVEPLSYPYLSGEEKLRFHSRLRSALIAVPSRALLLSVCARVDPHDVVGGMIAGVDLEENPVWREMCLTALDALSETEVYERRFYFAARLPEDGAGHAARQWLGAAAASVHDAFGLPALPPPAREVRARRRAAQQLEGRIGAFLGVRPVAARELFWLYRRALQRGPGEPVPEEPWEGTDPSGGALVALEDAVIKEGGHRDDPGRRRGHLRYLRIETPFGVSYQAFLALADMPHRFAFPDGGGEWFFHVDSLPFPVDWAAVVRAVPNPEAQRRVRGQARQLVQQFGEHEVDVAGPPTSLLEAIEGVRDEEGQLSANSSDPELHTTIALSLYAEDLEILEARTAAVRDLFAPNEYALWAPTGGQAGLFEATLPGGRLTQAARDYTQFLLPRDLAAGVPFAGSEIGDPQGFLLGFTVDAGCFRPVLFDPAYGPAIDRSASAGAFGRLGSGKSYAMKLAAYAVGAKGGQVVIPDRTPLGEYVRFAEVFPGTTQVVTVSAGTDVCLDPLKVFSRTEDGRRTAAKEGVRFTIGFLQLLTGAPPREPEGLAIREAVQEVAAAPDPDLPR